MPEKVEVLACDGALHVFKLGRRWRRDLVVEVAAAAGGARNRVDFPSASERVTVADLDPGVPYKVRIRRRLFWERWRYAAIEVEATPRSRPLRVLFTGSGRSGTQTLARYLDGMTFTDGEPVRARHEPLAEWVVPALADKDFDFPVLQQTGSLHNVESAPYYSLYPEVVRARKVIAVIRDGRRVVQSGLNRGWYSNDTAWNRIKPQYDTDDPFETACRLWVDANEGAAGIADRVFRLEDLVASPEALGELCTEADIVSDGRDLPHANRGGKPSTTWTEWDADQTRVFARICGPLMDLHYPGWRDRSLAAATKA